MPEHTPSATDETDADVVDDGSEVTERSDFVAVLGRPSRVKIIYALIGAMPLNPHDISEQAGISRNAFYENIDVLEEYGIVEQIGKAGNSPLYALTDSESVKWLTRFADTVSKDE